MFVSQDQSWFYLRPRSPFAPEHTAGFLSGRLEIFGCNNCCDFKTNWLSVLHESYCAGV